MQPHCLFLNTFFKFKKSWSFWYLFLIYKKLTGICTNRYMSWSYILAFTGSLSKYFSKEFWNSLQYGSVFKTFKPCERYLCFLKEWILQEYTSEFSNKSLWWRPVSLGIEFHSQQFSKKDYRTLDFWVYFQRNYSYSQRLTFTLDWHEATPVKSKIQKREMKTSNYTRML